MVDKNNFCAQMVKAVVVNKIYLLDFLRSFGQRMREWIQTEWWYGW